jgi:hypothetical protein
VTVLKREKKRVIFEGLHLDAEETEALLNLVSVYGACVATSPGPQGMHQYYILLRNAIENEELLPKISGRVTCEKMASGLKYVNGPILFDEEFPWDNVY